MSIRFLLSSALALSTMTLVMAESKTVTVTEAGTLQSQFTTDEMASVTELTVSGPINKTDLTFVNSSLTALETLNLKQSNIIEETIETETYKANTFPASSFSHNVTLKNISLPMSITEIGDNAFEFTKLENVDFSGCANLNMIGLEAFASNDYLKEVNLSNCTGLVTIGYNAFNSCGNKVDELGISETSINLSGCSALTTISDYAFSNHKKSTAIDFTGCTSLNYIGNRAFNNSKVILLDLSSCSSLETLTGYSFNLCTKIIDIILPINLKMIEAKTFPNASSSLVSVKSLATVPPTLVSGGFSATGVAKATLSVPVGAKAAYEADEEWAKCNEIVEDASLSVENAYTENLKVSAQNNIIKIYNIENGATINIYNMQGALVVTQIATDNHAEISLPVSGMYIVKCGKSIAKIML